MEFKPINYLQSAGLIFYYDTKNQFYLRLTHDDALGRALILTVTDDGTYSEPRPMVNATEWNECYLRATINEDRTQFSASPDGQRWQRVGPSLETTKLSDDYGRSLKFTGAMVGICCQDLGGTRAPVDFDYFDYSCGGG